MSVELIDGREVEKPLPKRLHIIIQSYLIVALSRLLSDRFMTLPECNVLTGGKTPEGRREYVVPDIVTIPVSAAFDEGDLAEPPLLGAEILSPGQTITELFAWADRLVKLGTDTVWVIWPEKRRAWEVGREQFDEAHSKLTLRLPVGTEPDYVNIHVAEMWAQLDRT